MKHRFASGKTDGADATLVQPSNWNDLHDYKTSALSANTTLDATHDLILATAGAGGITLTLPTASGIAGRPYTIVKVDSAAGVIKLAPNGSETICGAANYELQTQYSSVQIVSDGTNWVRSIGSDGLNDFVMTSIQAGDTVTTAGTFATNYTIKANRLQVGTVIELWATGTNSVSTGGSNFSYGIKFGTTTVLSGGNVFLNASSSGGWKLVAQLVVTSIGATGTIEIQGFLISATNNTGASVLHMANTAAVTVDTTADIVLNIAEIPNTSGTTPTTTMRQLNVKVRRNGS